MLHARSLLQSAALSLSAILLLAGCKAGSAAPPNGVGLPVPPGLRDAGRISAARSQPVRSQRLSPGRGVIELTPMGTVHLAFELSPRIRAAYLRYVAEKARYDYIMATWTSTTPGMAVGPGWIRTQDAADAATNQQTQKVEAFVEKNLLDTSRLRAFAGAINEDADQTHAFHPTAGGLLRFPLWGSREALQRSSEQIFQQTRLNDAQLEYVQAVREQLSSITATFFAVLGIGQRVEARQRQIDDLVAMEQRARAAGKPEADLRRIAAEISTATTELRNQQCNYAIEKAWMTSTMGLPRDREVRLVDGPFDLFDGTPHEQLLAMSMRTDPEIATLNNAIRDAEVQLALARRGKLDVTMSLGAAADFEGSGSRTGQTEYRADALLSVGFIDKRLSSSLMREASANIRQYQQAIQRRRNNVYVDTIEPLIKFRMLAKNIPEKQQTVERFRRDYEAAAQEYLAGRMDMDDLVRRRQDLLDEELQLSFNQSSQGTNMAWLAGATGKYFELLTEEEEQQGTGDRLQGTAGEDSAAAPGSQPLSVAARGSDDSKEVQP